MVTGENVPVICKLVPTWLLGKTVLLSASWYLHGNWENDPVVCKLVPNFVNGYGKNTTVFCKLVPKGSMGKIDRKQRGNTCIVLYCNLYCIDRCIYLNLFNSSGLKALRPAANGRYKCIQVFIHKQINMYTSGNQWHTYLDFFDQNFRPSSIFQEFFISVDVFLLVGKEQRISI